MQIRVIVGFQNTCGTNLTLTLAYPSSFLSPYHSLSLYTLPLYVPPYPFLPRLAHSIEVTAEKGVCANSLYHANEPKE